jgi:hypothetical protein
MDTLREAVTYAEPTADRADASRLPDHAPTITCGFDPGGELDVRQCSTTIPTGLTAMQWHEFGQVSRAYRPRPR